jgi:RHS repeat-associated protein
MRTRSSLLLRAALGGALVTFAAGAVLAQQHPNLERGFAADKVYQFGDVDKVNVLNGNVILNVPLGGTYPVNGDLSYALALTYNTKLWDHEVVYRADGEYNQSLPNRRSNAGLGWLLSLGRLIGPEDPTNNSAYAWVYESPDGGDHVFFSTLHNGEPAHAGVSYTRDGTYLRLKDLGAGVREVEFPNGHIHRFGGDNRINQIRDRFGNWIEITYPTTMSWKLRDMHGRELFVYFISALSDGRWINVVDRVVVPAFGGASATYQFVYTSTSVSRGCVTRLDPYLSGSVTVPLLTRIDMPDGSSYAFDYYADNADFSCRQGAVRSVQLPTLGKVEYTYQQYHLGIDGCNSSPWPYGSAGVKTRRLLGAAGEELGVWDYATELTNRTAGSICDEGFTRYSYQEMKNTVTTPLKDKTVHYFSVWPHPANSSDGFQAGEYGLPFTRFTTDATGTRYLSTQVLDCDAAGANCVQKRSSYVRYEREAGSCIYLDYRCFDTNRREASSRTVYDDDGGRVADVNRSNFDGLGHYRWTSTAGTFDSGNARDVGINYNPGRGEYRPDGSTVFTMLAPSDPWVLNSFSWRQVNEGASTEFTGYCYEGGNGFIRRKRVYKNSGTTENANDVLVVYDRDASGNLTREQYYGGDFQNLTADGSTCVMALPADQYRLDHTWQYGNLKTSQYVDVNGFALSFKSVDADIDWSTGMISASRDTAGLATSYEYDPLGRLTWEKPAQDGWTSYTYTRATSSAALARVNVDRRSNGGATILARSEFTFDALGRPWQERQLLPNGTWATRETLYNANGWKSSVSELGSTSKRTQFLSYDPFGRPGTIRPPDGSVHDVTISYNGVRRVSRGVKLGTSRDVNGNIVESTAWTTEIFDRQGRRWRVLEPANADGTNTTTTYAYDVGNRLRAVTQATASGTQNRYFIYDNRGFLNREQHPEKGATGNGSVYYYNYNARGHALRRVDGPNDLSFSYDRAERLLRVGETGGSGRLLKEFAYATANSAGNWKNGKLERADRYNYIQLGIYPYTDLVRETYTYGGTQGRVSNRDTQNLINGSQSDAYTQSWTYTALGDVASLGYPQCTTCPIPIPDTVSYGYTNGYLTSVPNHASSITYHPNGMIHRVTHANGVVDTYANDPNGMPRPSSITTTSGTATHWSSGTYSYDGSGNITKTGSSWFLYDAVGRVKTATLFDGSSGGGSQYQQSYTYDSFGNLQSISGSGGRSTPTASATNRLNATGVTYDAAGNLTAWNGNTYEYDRFNQLTRMRSGSEEWIHIYTADDERLWSYQVGPASKNHWTLRDLDGRVLREYSYDRVTFAWQRERQYVYRNGLLLVADRPDMRTQFHLDQLGTPRAITGSAGQRLAYHVYYPYGEELTYFAQDSERMKFTGHERDLASLAGAGDDLDYMHARHFSPLTGRFLSFDPIGGNPRAPQTWNRYAYAIGNPLKYVDPSGLVIHCGAPSNFHCSETITVTASANGLAPVDPRLVATHFSLTNSPGGLSRGFGLLDVSTAKAFYQGNFEHYAVEGNTFLAFLNFTVDELFVPESQGELGLELATAIVPGPFDNAALAGIKGSKFFQQFARRNPFGHSVRQLGDFTEFAVNVPGNVKGSFTRWVKVVNSDGRTIRLYHDTFDKSGRFVHRGIKVPGPERHVR